MNVLEFGDAKLALQDIDPLYRALKEMKWPRQKLCEYTLAFVSFDHAGLACWVCEHDNFWTGMTNAAENKLRGAPRRYFFPRVATPAVRTLRDRYGSAKTALDALAGPYAQAEALLRTWPHYGPTACFKLCDMAERVCGVNVDFSMVTPEQLMSNKMVTKGVYKAMHSLGVDSPNSLFRAMRRHPWRTLAGPGFDRPLNMQEFETILCYYSHDDGKNKHLPGMDIENICGELFGWGKIAERLIKCIRS
jgi:hypothetical protein